MGSAVLGEAISAIREWSIAKGEAASGGSATEGFGSLVFNDAVQEMLERGLLEVQKMIGGSEVQRIFGR